MEDEDGMENTHNQPVLLIGVGPGAVATLRQLPHAAKTLCVRVAGPFGLLTGRGSSGKVRASSCFWMSDISVPDATHEGAVVNGEFSESLFSDVCSLVRGLRAGGEETAAGRGSRVRIQAYAIADLAAPGVVPFILKLIQLVRRADPAIEVTGLALTGRSVETGTSQTPAWHEAFEQLVAGLEQAHLFQRLYILDGEDTNRTWLRNPEEIHRIGAEFILHHGLSPYRHHLRRREKTRTSLEERFLDFCGSVMCKRFSWDPATAAHEVAAVLAGDMALQELDQGALTQERSDILDGLVQRFVEDVSATYQEEESPSGPTPSAQVPPASAADQDQRVFQALERTLKEVCFEKPVLSLRWFLGRLRLQLDQLTTFSRLKARWDSRQRVARTLRQQIQDTYAPIRRWQEQRNVQWQTPFGPFFKETPSAMLSHPISVECYLLGMGIATVGLGMVGLGGWLRQPVPVVVGGIVAIWAGLVTVLPTRWVRHRRTIVPQDDSASQAVPASYYQAHPSKEQLASSALFLTAALGCLVWIFSGRDHEAAGADVVLFGGLSVVCGLVGATLVYLGMIRVRLPGGVPDHRQTPNMAPPRNKSWYVGGLVSLTAAWLFLCRANGSLQIPLNMTALVAGLASAWAGLALVQFPRYGNTKLACAGLRKPVPPAPLEARSVEGARLASQVERLRSWVDRLLVVAEPSQLNRLEWNEANLEDLLPRMFSPHWQNQLAQIFKKELESQTGKSLGQMVNDPANWARCLMDGLSDPDMEMNSPLHVFCLCHVKRWLQEKPLEQLLAQLKTDRGMLVSTVSASVAPRWPQTREDPEVDTSVIAVGKELWDIIAPFTDPDDPHHFVVVDWQDPYTVAVVRVVLGLSRGWRGYPGLQGQGGPAHDTEDKAPLIQTADPAG